MSKQPQIKKQKLKIRLKDVSAQGELCGGKAEKDMKRLGLVGDLLLGCMWGYIWESVQLLSKGKGHFQLPHPSAKGMGFVPLTPSPSGGGGQQVPEPLQQQYILPQAIYIINTVPYRGWAHITADFTGFFPALHPGWGFLVPAYCLSARS